MITFTQFLRPDGKRRIITIDRPSHIEAKAEKLVSRGCSFEIEQLTTRQISMEVMDEKCVAVCGELCDEGHAVPVAVDRMIQHAYELTS